MGTILESSASQSYQCKHTFPTNLLKTKPPLSQYGVPAKTLAKWDQPSRTKIRNTTGTNPLTQAKTKSHKASLNYLTDKPTTQPRPFRI